jgi:hypothetical protein
MDLRNNKCRRFPESGSLNAASLDRIACFKKGSIRAARLATIYLGECLDMQTDEERK